MLLIVDGTGEFDDGVYNASMATSFCKQLEKIANGRYFRGPSTDGFRTFEKSKTLVRIVLDRTGAAAGEKIYLAGHSRGGAAIIHAAQLLQRLKYDVEAMFLFDAVDRTIHFDVDVTKVPGNVKRCYHARRFPHLGKHFRKEVQKARMDWDRALSQGENTSAARMAGHIYEVARLKDMIVRKFTRCENISEIGYNSIDFGNCGIQGEGACRYSQKFFLGTHGALGGAPALDHGIKELTEIDNAAMAEVKGWMNGALAREGLLQLTAN